MPQGVIEKIRKRIKYPVTLPNGETIHIRPMNFGEQFRLEGLKGNARLGFVVGCVLLEEDGTNLFEKKPDENDAAFAARVASECEIDVPAFFAIKAAIDKLEKVPDAKVIEKNSEETSTQG